MTRSTRTAAHPPGPQSLRRVISQHRVALAVTLGSCATMLALVSWFLASAPLTGVEPRGGFVDCGPALLGRPSPLPDPACAGAYWPLVPLSVTLGVLAVVGLTTAAWIVIRLRPSHHRHRA